MSKFVAVPVSSNIIGQAEDKVVYYAVERIIKVEQGPHGGSLVTVLGERPGQVTETISSSASVMDILSSDCEMN